MASIKMPLALSTQRSGLTSLSLSWRAVLNALASKMRSKTTGPSRSWNYRIFVKTQHISHSWR